MATTKFRGVVNATGGFQVNSSPISTMTFSKVDVTDSTLTVDATTHGGKIVTLSRAAGITVTLPAATGSGIVYRFYVAIAVTTNNDIIKVANASDTMVGTVLSTLAAGGTTFGETAGGTDDTITMNGTTTGGLIGSYVELTDWATNVWYVYGSLAGSGTLASSLSATV